MKKDICKKFVDFKARYSLSNDAIAQVVTEYANSDTNFACSFYSSKYDIPKDAFYKARDYAIIIGLVDDKVWEKLKKKSSINSSRNNYQSSSRKTLAHYSQLLYERKQFLDSFSVEEIKDIGYKYLEGVGIKRIAIAYDCGEYAIKCLLRKGITSLIFDANTVKSINVFVGDELNQIMERREKNKEALLDCLQKQIAFLQSQIRCYDLYFVYSSNKPELSYLQDKYAKIIRFYEKVLLL